MIYLVLGALLVILSSAIYGPPLLGASRTYFRLLASQQLICPETGRSAMVKLSAAHAAWTHLAGGGPNFQVKSCTRWPGHRGCDQGCTAELEEAGAARSKSFTPLAGYRTG